MKDFGRGLYAILDKGDFEQLRSLGLALLKKPLCALQIRAKTLSAPERICLLLEIANAIKMLDGNPCLITNDEPLLAKRFGTAVHLGQSDTSVRQARQILGPNGLIGVSTHSLEQALIAQDEGANYLGYGPIFETTSKEKALPPRGIKGLEEILKNVSLPVVAIGGVNAENISAVIATGVPSIAVISALHDPVFFEKMAAFDAEIKKAGTKSLPFKNHQKILTSRQ